SSPVQPSSSAGCGGGRRRPRPRDRCVAPKLLAAGLTARLTDHLPVSCRSPPSPCAPTRFPVARWQPRETYLRHTAGQFFPEIEKPEPTCQSLSSCRFHLHLQPELPRGCRRLSAPAGCSPRLKFPAALLSRAA